MVVEVAESLGIHLDNLDFSDMYKDDNNMYKDENNVYYRVVKDIDIATQEGKDRILNIIGNGVLKNVAARVSVDGRPTAGSPAHTFLRSLRDKPNLHFV